MLAESTFRGVVLAWSLMSAAGLSVALVMYRASHADIRNIPSGEYEILGRRVVRGAFSRVVVFVTYLLASGTLWSLPAVADGLAPLVVRMGFAVIFAVSSLVLLVVSVRDLMDTLNLLDRKPLDPDTPIGNDARIPTL